MLESFFFIGLMAGAIWNQRQVSTLEQEMLNLAAFGVGLVGLIFTAF